MTGRHTRTAAFRQLETVTQRLGDVRKTMSALVTHLSLELAAVKETVETLEHVRNEAAGILRDAGASNAEVARALNLSDSAASKAVRSTGRPPLLRREPPTPDA